MGNAYINRILKDSDMMFIYISIVFLSFFAISITDDYKQKFMVIVFVVVVLVYYYNYTTVIIQKEKDTTDKFIKNQKTVKNIEFVLPHTFQYHKNPKKIKYIVPNKDVMEIINNLSFLRYFDEASYEMIVILTEYFYKMHYNILAHKYDCRQYFNIMIDVRKELLNTCSELMFNIPQFSKHQEGNLWEKAQINCKKLQAKTFRCMKIISHHAKENCSTVFDYKGPFPSDPSDNKHRLF